MALLDLVGIGTPVAPADDRWTIMQGLDGLDYQALTSSYGTPAAGRKACNILRTVNHLDIRKSLAYWNMRSGATSERASTWRPLCVAAFRRSPAV